MTAPLAFLLVECLLVLQRRALPCATRVCHRGVFIGLGWMHQVWAATTADVADWPDGHFRGPTLLNLRGSGPRNTGIFTAEAKKRLVYPFPDPSAGAVDPRPLEPAVGVRDRAGWE